MRKTLLILVLFISLKSTAQLKPLSERVFLYHIGIVENVVKVGYGEGYLMDQSIEFLESLTEIKSEGQGTYGGWFNNPTKANLRAWKKWFKKHKKRLRWDNKNKIMSLE